jgi:hypothetical protein
VTADRVLRVHDDPAWLLHLELQSSRDPDLLAIFYLYNALLERRHGPPVRTLVVLLRRSATASDSTGVLHREATPEEAGMLWTAADMLMSLRYSRTLVTQLHQRVHGMKESVTYQAIVEEGKIESRQEVLLEFGQKLFGAPTEATVRTVWSIMDLDRLKRLSDRLLDVSSWEELLATP